MHRTNSDKFKTKKKVKISSLEAAICNVALFKGMKDKEFRDTIFISYCEDGVILEAINEAEWKRASDYISNFLQSKRIALLADNFEKEAYEELISRGLKDITRKIKERNEECPYINIIHYQKLRKSCEYMDKEHYVEPLKDWERKSKRNPNFAFLIVQPKHKFDEVKRALLEFLNGQPVQLTSQTLLPISFIYLLCYSPIKEKVKEAYIHKRIQIQIQEDEKKSSIKATNFSSINLKEYSYTIVDENKNISKTGMEFLTCKDLRKQIKNCKSYCKENPTDVLESAIEHLQASHGQNFMIVAYKQEDQEKYKAAINKYANTSYSKEEISRKIQSNMVFSYSDIEFIDLIQQSKNYKTWKVCINQCPFMVQEYQASSLDIDSFVLYLDQLQTYYCTYMVRYYGVSLKYGSRQAKDKKQRSTPIQSYLLIFDHHHCSLRFMLENDMILDSMQIGTIALHLLYFVNFLHAHEQPRCLGQIKLAEVFWPMAVILPYMGQGDDKESMSVENDVRSVGQVLKKLLGEEGDEDFDKLIDKMTQQNKYERPSVKRCMGELEDILSL